MKAAERLSRMEGLLREPDPARKRLIALGILSDRLREDGLEPILVGGAALEFYTAGGYTTKDVDLALPTCPEVDAAFAELGFVKEGRYWFHGELDLLFEAPAPAGLPGETSPRTEVEIEGLRVVIIGLEDLLLDRMRAWIHWKSEEDRRWARRLALLYSDKLDWDYLHSRSRGDASESRAVSELEKEAVE